MFKIPHADYTDHANHVNHTDHAGYHDIRIYSKQFPCRAASFQGRLLFYGEWPGFMK